MYELTLFLHSLNRWLLTIFALFVIASAYKGWLLNEQYKAYHAKAMLITVILADIQLLIGLALYFGLSPAVPPFSEFGSIMKERVPRFWAVEHLTNGILTVLFIHLAKIFAAKHDESRRKFKRTALFMTLAVIALMLSIPWPGMPQGRPLIPSL